MSSHAFDQVYVGDAGERGKHLHATGMCDHTSELVVATTQEIADLPECGQCLNRIEEIGGEIVNPKALKACPHFTVGPCDLCAEAFEA